jgi:hypothetical protein
MQLPGAPVQVYTEVPELVPPDPPDPGKPSPSKLYSLSHEINDKARINPVKNNLVVRIIKTNFRYCKNILSAAFSNHLKKEATE